MAVQIITYSARAIVVTGETKPIKDILKQAGGKFNARLKHPETKQPLIGWIFSKTREKALIDLLTGNDVKVNRPIPDNINDKNAGQFIQDPAEIDADNFCQRNNI